MVNYYELRIGKFGQYIHFNVEKRDVPLEDIITLLNYYSGKEIVRHQEIVKLKLKNYSEELIEKESGR